MNRDKLLAMTDEELLKHCRQDCFRASGPGGQHRNTRDSAVRFTLLDADAVSAQADERRSQHQNRKAALLRLRMEIAYHIRTDDVEPWKGQLKFNSENPEYPVFVGVVLDSLSLNGWRVGDAARALGLSTGKLNRCLFNDRRLWQFINSQRVDAGMKALRSPN